MKIVMNVNTWLEVKQYGDEIILWTYDNNGQEIELHFDKRKWLHKRWLKQFIKDLEETAQ